MGIKDSNNQPFAARRKPITAPEQKAMTEAFPFSLHWLQELF
jgi:hypothetical protein